MKPVSVLVVFNLDDFGVQWKPKTFILLNMHSPGSGVKETEGCSKERWSSFRLGHFFQERIRVVWGLANDSSQQGRPTGKRKHMSYKNIAASLPSSNYPTRIFPVDHSNK